MLARQESLGIRAFGQAQGAAADMPRFCHQACGHKRNPQLNNPSQQQHEYSRITGGSLRNLTLMLLLYSSHLNQARDSNACAIDASYDG